MNTTITIKNENGEYSVSAPINNSVDELLDMVVLCAELSGWNRSTIEQAIIEKSYELQTDESD
jgi:hypothetical protein